MDIAHWTEMAKKLDSEKEGKGETRERLEKLFERFHLVNRKYLDKETFEKARGSAATMVEAMASTVRFLDTEVARLRSKRTKLPGEDIDFHEMQKAQARNELLLKEYEASFKP